MRSCATTRPGFMDETDRHDGPARAAGLKKQMAPPYGDVNLRRFDLNLLPVLRALLSTHSVARASEIVGLSQSATSGALTRLRGMFGDQLLVQVGRKLVPTPLALELLPIVENSFAGLHTVFNKRTFDPANEARQFVVTTSDYVVNELCSPLLDRLSEEAPNVSVKFVPISLVNRAAMVGGEIDLLLTPQSNSPDADNVHVTKLTEDEMCIISAANFPMPAGGLDMATYLAADHAAYAVTDGETFEQWALRQQGITRRIRIMVPQFILLPKCVSRGGLLAMMPRHIANRAAREFNLKVWPVPFPIPRLCFSLYWSEVLHENPPHQWFRRLLAKAWTTAQPDMSGIQEGETA